MKPVDCDTVGDCAECPDSCMTKSEYDMWIHIRDLQTLVREADVSEQLRERLHHYVDEISDTFCDICPKGD